MKRLHYIFFILLLSCSALVYAQKAPIFKVVLDAGHGGKDPGKVAPGKIYEKDIVLNIVLAVGKKLSAHSDIKVIYTRKDDTFVDLYQRGAIANKAKANLFVSVHCNAHDTQVSGAETFVLGLHANEQNFQVAKAENEVIYLEDNYEKKYADYNINSPESFIGLSIMQEEFLEQSIHLAKLLQHNFTHEMKRLNRGVKQAGFIVLHQTYMPSVLIETAFMSNKDELKYLNSAKGQEDFAENIANAILSYKKWIEGKSAPSDYEETIIRSTSTDNKSPQRTTTTKAKTNVSKSKTASKSNIIYKVQISSSPKKIEAKSFNFKGLSPVSVEKDGKIYCYMYGNAKKHRDAAALLTKAKKKRI